MGKGQLTAAIGVGMGLVILGGCRSSHLDADSCLADVEANALDRALQRCNQVVTAHPDDPRPHNDRFLLHTLLQNKQAACQDIAKAAALLQSGGADHHKDIRAEILVRADSCR
tara:strand:+ start:130 stop:468 length:339 start_codon:yes stop_codon:yes gene_type:complete